MKRQGPISVQLFPWAVLRLTSLEKRPLTGDRKDKVVSLRAFKDLLCGDKGHSGLELT